MQRSLRCVVMSAFQYVQLFCLIFHRNQSTGQEMRDKLPLTLETLQNHLIRHFDCDFRMIFFVLFFHCIKISTIISHRYIYMCAACTKKKHQTFFGGGYS